jgi:kynurenine formamidase
MGSRLVPAGTFPEHDAKAQGPGTATKGEAMKIVDLSHTMNVHTPGWVGYAGNKMYYAQNLQTVRIVAQRIDTSLHVGTHFDGAMHATDDPKGDMAHLPMDYLVNRGVVVDISKHMTDWAVITPEIIESSGADIREGDILILHTGWHRHYELPPRPQPRHAALDVQEEDQVVGHGHRLLRPRDEYLDSLHAAGARRGIHEEARQDAG